MESRGKLPVVYVQGMIEGKSMSLGFGPEDWGALEHGRGMCRFFVTDPRIRQKVKDNVMPGFEGPVLVRFFVQLLGSEITEKLYPELHLPISLVRGGRIGIMSKPARELGKAVEEVIFRKDAARDPKEFTDYLGVDRCVLFECGLEKIELHYSPSAKVWFFSKASFAFHTACLVAWTMLGDRFTEREDLRYFYPFLRARDLSVRQAAHLSMPPTVLEVRCQSSSYVSPEEEEDDLAHRTPLISGEVAEELHRLIQPDPADLIPSRETSSPSVLTADLPPSVTLPLPEVEMEQTHGTGPWHSKSSALLSFTQVCGDLVKAANSTQAVTTDFTRWIEEVYDHIRQERERLETEAETLRQESAQQRQWKEETRSAIRQEGQRFLEEQLATKLEQLRTEAAKQASEADESSLDQRQAELEQQYQERLEMVNLQLEQRLTELDDDYKGAIDVLDAQLDELAQIFEEQERRLALIIAEEGRLKAVAEKLGDAALQALAQANPQVVEERLRAKARIEAEKQLLQERRSNKPYVHGSRGTRRWRREHS